MPSSSLSVLVGSARFRLETGLDLAALLFLPVLALVSHWLAPLEAIAGLFALGLALRGRVIAWRDLAAPAAPFAVLVLWGVLSALWSIDPARSLLIALRLAGLFAAGLALLVSVPAIAEPERLLRCFFAGLLIALAILIIQRATGGLLTRPFFVRPFAAPQLNQASDTLAILALPMSATLWLRRRRGAPLLLLAATAAVIYGLVGTAAQACLVGGALAALPFTRWRRILAPAAALVSVLVIVTAPLTFARFAQIAPLLHTADEFKSSVPHRLLIWSFAGERIAEKPLLGWGLDSSRAIPGGKAWIRPTQSWLPLHPHNAPLQLWLELGVPGAVLLALVAARLWLALGRWRAPPLFAAAGAGALAAAFAETLGTYGMWEEWWVGTLWFALFLILVMARSFEPAVQKRSQVRAAAT
ncbi:MAG: O-antigen ligase family protein [Stellaceae bacterium]